ncbi:glycerophosphodiester phosphodiesterase family protein [Bdellovibrio sp. SKB1291214]|uniref:glycerophosphodiester phosphodiesterase family protein n=1 Tax=Bdellovibrio sp. SKB1291214 TaxID=1732569 RepID=UPI000B518641|nr:glycerophosphodiester phosphodiesterase family protein [Bdellovibrio sp. SKB1291214]UYL08409.1 glycerophosphodiester phosphodiesterase family protein [Bdellovibrio sp. SKB1291214]
MQLNSILIFSLALLPLTPMAQATPQVSRSLASAGLNITPCITASQMVVHGHRGMNGYPDNTIASFKAAYDVGVDWAELDLQVTSDNHIVVAHDAIPNVNVERCGVKGKSLLKAALFDMTYEQEKEVRCGIKKFDESKLEPIPELKEVFAVFKDRKAKSGKPVGLNIEVKYFLDQQQFYPPQAEYIEMIIKVIREGGWSNDRFFVQSFNQEFLKKFKEKAPDIQVVPLIGDARAAEKAAKDTGATTVTPGFWQVTPELILNLHKKGIKAIVWTPNQESEIRKVIESGADGIITDYPELFFKIREELCNP